MFNPAITLDNQDQMALSMTRTNVLAPYDADLTNVNACITTADLMIMVNQTNTCASNSKTAPDSVGASGLLTAVEKVDPADLPTDAAAANYADNLPTFTDANRFKCGTAIVIQLLRSCRLSLPRTLSNA